MQFKKDEIVNNVTTELGIFITKPENIEALEDGSGISLNNSKKEVCIALNGIFHNLSHNKIILPHGRLLYVTEDELKEPVECIGEEEL